MGETPTSQDLMRFGDMIRIMIPGHKYNGRIGKIVSGANHPQAIPLEVNQYWVQLISDDGDPFYGRYMRDQLQLAHK